MATKTTKTTKTEKQPVREYQLFGTKDDVQGKEVSAPLMVKAKDFPDGGTISGKFIGIDCHEIEEVINKKKQKKNIGSIILEQGDRKIKIGITAMISYGLKIEGMEEGKPVSPFIGKNISILKDGMLPSKKGNDAHNFRIFIA